MQNTSESFLHKLMKEFAIQPAQLFCCYLYDVLPLSNHAGASSSSSSKRELVWSDDACKYFKTLVEGHTLTGYVFERSTNLITEGLPDFIGTYGVILQDEQRGSSCTLNAQMVDAGYAKPIGIM